MSTIVLPTTFAETVAQVRSFVGKEFDREIAQKQLYYHNWEHVHHVLRRADVLFQTIVPDWSLDSQISPSELERNKLLLDLCVVAHDLVQTFLPLAEPHSPRRRESGVSEMISIDKLVSYIESLNHQLQEHSYRAAMFSIDELRLIREAIKCTICSYSIEEQAIYQPRLYDGSYPISYLSRILALADIGSLGMDGLAVYNWEGSLVFLEENLDFVPFLRNQSIYHLQVDNPELYENLRQRLLRRARFQVHFARSRLSRTPQELDAFPGKATPMLLKTVFQHLSPATIQEVEQTTPTDEQTSMEELLEFFRLDYLCKQFEQTYGALESE